MEKGDLGAEEVLRRIGGGGGGRKNSASEQIVRLSQVWSLQRKLSFTQDEQLKIDFFILQIYKQLPLLPQPNKRYKKQKKTKRWGKD